MYLAYQHEPMLRNATELNMCIFVITWLYSDDLHWTESAMQGVNVMRSTRSDFEIGVLSIPVRHVYNCQRLADTRFVNFFCANLFQRKYRW